MSPQLGVEIPPLKKTKTDMQYQLVGHLNWILFSIETASSLFHLRIQGHRKKEPGRNAFLQP